MPRIIPPLDREFTRQLSLAFEFVARVEAVNMAARQDRRLALSTANVELSYELAFLRIFLAWELFLEDALTRFISGYHHSSGREPLKPGQQYFRSLSLAETAILGGGRYRLWHNPTHVISRAQTYLQNSRYELIIASAQVRIGYFAAIRHRIAHAQKHAAVEFDMTTMMLTGRRYRGSRPGRFLRDRVPSLQPPVRWISAIGSELEGLARQICA
jgi:hypothetical protein